MNRRQFLKTTALTGTSATLASCGNPEYHLIRFIPEERLIAGVSVWKPSVCPLCSAACGLTVRVMEGEAEVLRNDQVGITKMGLAKKLEGNPAHPVNQGKLCPRGQAAIQVTYHPDRIGHPLKRSGERGSGQFQEITWDQALGELVSHLDMLSDANDQQSVSFMAGPRQGVRRELMGQFASRYGAASPITFEFFDNDVLRRANALSFGKEQLPTFDFGESRYVIGFGADFLGTWNSPVAQNVAFGHMRQGRPNVRGKFVHVEYRMSQTGANADEWIPVKPGLEGVLALGLAHVIIKGGLRGDAAGRAGSLIEGWSGGLAEYTPQEVEKRTGVAAARIERIAKEFVEQRPAVAVIGGYPLAQTNGLFNALAVNALNALVGSVEIPGGIFFTPQVNLSALRTGPAQTSQAAAPLNKVAADLLSAQKSPIQLLLLDGANPVFASPPAWKVRDALMKVPFIVSFGNFLDETSILSDLILPDHSFLESWSEGIPESGSKVPVTSLGAPVMRPLHDTRAMPDVLLDIGRRLKKPLNPALPWKDFQEMLRAVAGTEWDTAQKQGGIWSETAARPAAQAPSGVASGRAVRFADPQFDGETNEYPFHFLPYASQAFLDGSLAHLPWLQELPDPLSSAMWSSWIEVNPQTASRLGIQQGDLVEIASRQGTLRAPAFVSPGIAPDMVAMPVGQGHQTFTRYASGRGENPISILAPIVEPETGSLAWAATRVKISKVAASDGRLILFAGSLRNESTEIEHR